MACIWNKRLHEYLNKDGTTPLGKAVCRDGRVDQVRDLIATGCSVNKPDKKNKTPLQIALTNATSDLLEYVTLLLDAGATTKKQQGSPHLIELVLRAGKDDSNAGTYLPVVQKLIEAGCDVNERSKMYFPECPRQAVWRTPLFITAEFNLPDIAQLLLDGGADPDLACDDYSSRYKPIHMSAWYEHIKVSKILIQANCDRHALSVPIPGSRYCSNIPKIATPLVCALTNPDTLFLPLMLSADFQVERETIKEPLEPYEESHLKEFRTSPKTLQCLVRNTIRTRLQGANIKKKIPELGLPRALADDILFRHF